MNPLVINVYNWDTIASKVLQVNADLHKLLEPIALILKEQQRDYFYQMSFVFGQVLIEDGQMVALKKYDKGYSNIDKLLFKIVGPSVSHNIDYQRFIEDCGQDTDHPLSLVTKNFIEVYCTHYSSYKSADQIGNNIKYSFPLNVIEEGQLFGVYGAVNSIFEDYKKNYYGWNAVAGKRCILPLFPDPNQRQSTKSYRTNFQRIFTNSSYTALDGIINVANEILNNQPFAEIVIIPESFYKYNHDDSTTLQEAKYRLREYIFGIAWDQTKNSREMAWDDKELMKEMKINDPDFAFHLIKHIVNISLGYSFMLKPISEDDGILFDVFKTLVRRFHQTAYDKSTLLDYSTPIFMHYSRLSKENPKGIELTHSPSLNIYLPATRLDTMMNTIMYQVLFKNKVQNYMKEKGYDILLTYYKENNSDGFADYVHNRGEYIKNDLGSLYASLLPNGAIVRLPKVPTLFNSFIQIERNNW